MSVIKPRPELEQNGWVSSSASVVSVAAGVAVAESGAAAAAPEISPVIKKFTELFSLDATQASKKINKFDLNFNEYRLGCEPDELAAFCHKLKAANKLLINGQTPSLHIIVSEGDLGDLKIDTCLRLLSLMVASENNQTGEKLISPKLFDYLSFYKADPTPVTKDKQTGYKNIHEALKNLMEKKTEASQKAFVYYGEIQARTKFLSTKELELQKEAAISAITAEKPALVGEISINALSGAPQYWVNKEMSHPELTNAIVAGGYNWIQCIQEEVKVLLGKQKQSIAEEAEKGISPKLQGDERDAAIKTLIKEMTDKHKVALEKEIMLEKEAALGKCRNVWPSEIFYATRKPRLERDGSWDGKSWVDFNRILKTDFPEIFATLHSESASLIQQGLLMAFQAWSKVGYDERITQLQEYTFKSGQPFTPAQVFLQNLGNLKQYPNKEVALKEIYDAEVAKLSPELQQEAHDLSKARERAGILFNMVKNDNFEGVMTGLTISLVQESPEELINQECLSKGTIRFVQAGDRINAIPTSDPQGRGNCFILTEGKIETEHRAVVETDKAGLKKEVNKLFVTKAPSGIKLDVLVKMWHAFFASLNPNQ